MNPNHPLECLRAKWRQYLAEHRHHIYKAANPRIIESRNSNKVRYRWLLLVEQSPKRALVKSEQACVRQHLTLAKTRKEAVYLVVGFIRQPGRIVVIPANKALKVKHVLSHKGGIDWDE